MRGGWLREEASVSQDQAIEIANEMAQKQAYAVSQDNRKSQRMRFMDQITQLIDRVVALEKRVAELEKRQPMVVSYICWVRP